MRTTLIALLFCAVFGVNAQHQFAVGFRLGDPSGITARLYTQTNRFEMNLGRSHVFYGKSWYENQFDPWYDAQDFGYKEVQFLRYKSSFPLALQLHRIHQKPWKKLGTKSSICSTGTMVTGFSLHSRSTNMNTDTR